MSTIIDTMKTWDDTRVTTAWKEMSRLVGLPSNILRSIASPDEVAQTLVKTNAVADTLTPSHDDLALGTQRTERGLTICRNVLLGFAVYMSAVALSPAGGPAWFLVVAGILALAYQAHRTAAALETRLLNRWRNRWSTIAAVRIIASDKTNNSDYAVSARVWKPLSPENIIILPLEELMEARVKRAETEDKK